MTPLAWVLAEKEAGREDGPILRRINRWIDKR
jgi:hypothetical protein